MQRFCLGRKRKKGDLQRLRKAKDEDFEGLKIWSDADVDDKS